MALPEEIFREIFYYLSNSTLYFSLRKVCKQMCHYVDRYIVVRGTFFLVSWEKCRPNQIIDVIKTPSKRFKIDWKTNIWFPNRPDSLEKTKIGCSCECKDNPLWYSIIDASINCSVTDGRKFIFYRYDILSNKWNIGSENCNVFRRAIDGKRRLTYYRTPSTLHSLNHCRPILLPENIQDKYDRGSYRTGKNLFLQLSGETNEKLDGAYEAQFCSCKIDLNRCVINRYILQANLNKNGYDITRNIDYMADMPNRTRPIFFKLKESLYIAGSYPIWSKIKGWMGTDHRNLVLNKFQHYTGDNFKTADCVCCDKFDLSNEKYYPNICSIPAPLTYLTNLKVTTNKNESLAIIHFYDPIACREKIWLFNELDEQFEEHWDPNSKACSKCQRITDDQDLNNSTTILSRMKLHMDHNQWKMRLLSIH